MFSSLAEADASVGGRLLRKRGSFLRATVLKTILFAFEFVLNDSLDATVGVSSTSSQGGCIVLSGDVGLRLGDSMRLMVLVVF